MRRIVLLISAIVMALTFLAGIGIIESIEFLNDWFTRMTMFFIALVVFLYKSGLWPTGNNADKPVE